LASRRRASSSSWPGSRSGLGSEPTLRLDPGSAAVAIDSDGSLGEGFAVEVDIVARVLRLRLLRLQGGGVVIPAHASPVERVTPREHHAPSSATATTRSNTPALRAIGTGNLGDAQRLLDESAQILARARDQSTDAE